MPSSKGIHRVLVADDEPQIGSFVKAALLQEGHFVTLCRDGVEVIKALESGKYSVMVLDNLMPRKTGVEVVLELRGAGDPIPAIIMSSYISDETRSACEPIERLTFLQKPFGIDELRIAIARVAGSVRI
jgi:DNA-binding response OmpR family regulator